jgi:hypothetical protein
MGSDRSRGRRAAWHVSAVIAALAIAGVGVTMLQRHGLLPGGAVAQPRPDAPADSPGIVAAVLDLAFDAAFVTCRFPAAQGLPPGGREPDVAALSGQISERLVQRVADDAPVPTDLVHRTGKSR